MKNELQILFFGAILISSFFIFPENAREIISNTYYQIGLGLIILLGIFLLWIRFKE